MNIVWKKLNFKAVPREKAPRKRVPRVSINSQSGRISLNAAACGLLPELFFYSSVDIVKGFSEEDEPVAWGFQFVQDERAPAGEFKLHKTTRDDKSVKSCVIVSKKLARALLGEGREKALCPVTKLNDFMLGIEAQPTVSAESA